MKMLIHNMFPKFLILMEFCYELFDLSGECNKYTVYQISMPGAQPTVEQAFQSGCPQPQRNALINEDSVIARTNCFSFPHVLEVAEDLIDHFNLNQSLDIGLKEWSFLVPTIGSISRSRYWEPLILGEMLLFT